MWVEYPDTQEGESVDDARRRIDHALGVQYWRVSRSSPEREPEPDATPTPYWWTGDEDASQTFLHEMGVVL